MRCILVAVDFSEITDSLLSYASAMARFAGSSVHLLHVAAPDPSFVGYEPGPAAVRLQVARELRGEHHDLQVLAKRLREQGIEVHAATMQGPTVATVVARARQLGAGAIVVGSHGHSRLSRALLGSVSEGVLRHAPCPVLIVPSVRKE